MSSDEPMASAQPDEARTAPPKSDACSGIAQDLLCPSCGYNLRGLLKNRCPECGRAFDPASLALSQIPWTHRQRIGRFRAYAQTVWLVMFRNPRFCQEFVWPVSYADAQRFRWGTVLLAYVPLLAVTLDRTFPDVGSIVAVQAALLLSLAVATSVPSYFFHPRRLPIEQQNRLVAMSYYASAPLAATPLIVAFGWALDHAVGSRAVCAVIAAGLGLAQLVAWWLCLIRVGRRSLPPGLRGIVPVVLVMPVVWGLAVGATLLGVDMAIRFPGLIYYSLQG